MSSAVVKAPVYESVLIVRFSALDYFLWSYVKSLAYTDKPTSIDALADNIEAFIREIPAKMFERVCQNWTKRMDHLRRSRDQHLHKIVCKH